LQEWVVMFGGSSSSIAVAGGSAKRIFVYFATAHTGNRYCASYMRLMSLRYSRANFALSAVSARLAR
jgi:hypothetical protein